MEARHAGVSTVYAIGGLIVVLLVAGYWLYRRGRSARAGDDAIASNKVKDEQLKAAAEAPKTPKDLAEHLRKGGEF